MFVIVVVLKWRSNKTRQQHMMAKTIKIINIKRQIAEYKEKLSNCNDFISDVRQKQLAASVLPVNNATKDEDKLCQLNNNAVTGKEIVVWKPKEKQQLSKLLEGKTFVLTLDVQKFNVDVKRCKLQPSMLDWTVEKPCCLEIVPWQAKPEHVITSHETTSPPQEAYKIDAITKHLESTPCLQINEIKGNEIVLPKHMVKDHLMKLLEVHQKQMQKENITSREDGEQG
ncbi:uncharacterized protein LOC114575126 [Exaiptasia diaphana]|uniref:Uncharacterized protein n=1 Tax=Exaiptasia diaphana TaxID=2652724 RepID=A0A913YID2_EXADI|nr:uncharacterized protein LOC114575126 [Exaiptasia diaphana]